MIGSYSAPDVKVWQDQGMKNMLILLFALTSCAGSSPEIASDLAADGSPAPDDTSPTAAADAAGTTDAEALDMAVAPDAEASETSPLEARQIDGWRVIPIPPGHCAAVSGDFWITWAYLVGQIDPVTHSCVTVTNTDACTRAEARPYCVGDVVEIAATAAPGGALRVELADLVAGACPVACAD